MSEITLRDIINWVDENIEDFILGEGGCISRNPRVKELKQKLHKLEKRIEKMMGGHMDEFFWNIDNECSEEIIAVLNQILGEKR